MVLVELGAFVVFAGLVSAWTMWVFAHKNGGGTGEEGDENTEGTRNLAGTYTTGECSYGLARVHEGTKEEEEEKEKVGAEESTQEDCEDFEQNAENIESPDVLYWDGEKYTAKDEEEKKDE